MDRVEDSGSLGDGSNPSRGTRYKFNHASYDLRTLVEQQSKLSDMKFSISYSDRGHKINNEKQHIF